MWQRVVCAFFFSEVNVKERVATCVADTWSVCLVCPVKATRLALFILQLKMQAGRSTHLLHYVVQECITYIVKCGGV